MGKSQTKFPADCCSHHVQTLVLKGKLFLAPIENPQLVVDIGTGTGIWAV